MKVIELLNICKSFSGNKANENVCLDLEKGEIHALLGENGAGKSTLMNILYGLYSCDSGTICVKGKNVHIDNPKTAIMNGIGMVHQHFMLIPQLTVTQNIFLGMKESGFFLKMDELHKKVEELNRNFGFNVDPKSIIWQLPVGVQQKVEILKALMRKAEILILDEPTAVLTPNEVDELFVSLKRLTGEGYSIILITHKMEEVMKYCDRVSVMREGCLITTALVRDTNMDLLAKSMVGRDVCLERTMEEHERGKTLIKLEEVTVNNDNGLTAVNNVSLEVAEGEILGVAGVDGNGQLELGEAIVGLRRIKSGKVTVCGENRTNSSPRELMDLGMAHIPDDRHKKGLVLEFTIKENLILGAQRMKKYCRGLFLNERKIEENAHRLAEDFDIRPRNTGLTGGMLSGGNQQKIILAREVSRNPKILIALQPTRGLDIGAIEFVRNKIKEERKNNKAILLVSTDLDEILTLSDRIAIMYKGEIIGMVRPDTPINEIGLLMGGIKPKIEAKEGEAS